MTKLPAFSASYADWKLIKTRGVVQVVMEVPLADADAAYDVLGGMPVHGKERWFGIAALKSPAQKEAPAAPRQASSPSTPTGGAKRMDWRDMPPAAQAALRCEQPAFHAFLREEMKYPDVTDTDTAAVAVRHICKVKSRSEFSTDHRKRVLWHQLDSAFAAWKALEHA